MGDALSGLRILVTEDESLVALAIEAMLLDLGCTVVGPIATLESALQAARMESVDGALLDVNLRGTKVFPAVDVLLTRGIPVILSTGYDDPSMFPEQYRGLPRLLKPLDHARLLALMERIFIAPGGKLT